MMSDQTLNSYTQDAKLDVLVSQRIDQMEQGITVVLQMLETIADQGEILPDGMYHYLWVKLEKLRAVKASFIHQ